MLLDIGSNFYLLLLGIQFILNNYRPTESWEPNSNCSISYERKKDYDNV